jgi:hypothetical protein
MSREEIFRCDGCRTQKTVANHWWLISPPTGNERSLMIQPWSVDAAFEVDTEHYCGSECVQRRIALFMTEKR